MRKGKALAALVLLLCGAPAVGEAGWEVRTYTDDVSGEETAYLGLISDKMDETGGQLFLGYYCNENDITRQLFIYTRRGFTVDDMTRHGTRTQRSRVRFDDEAPWDIGLEVVTSKFAKPMLPKLKDYADRSSDPPFLREMMKEEREKLRAGEKMYWEAFVEKNWILKNYVN